MRLRQEEGALGKGTRQPELSQATQMVVECSGQVRAGSLLAEPAPTYPVRGENTAGILRAFTGIYQPREHISSTCILCPSDE
jgi:hypothetical protein